MDTPVEATFLAPSFLEVLNIQEWETLIQVEDIHAIQTTAILALTETSNEHRTMATLGSSIQHMGGEEKILGL
ncbi:hypothetical protein QR680_003608 [Steinernema hermaphroditum]|uniref:Uncharacterized protein n=1 Tax=Steinernema hermaphroditum TaxID=289476 RepID=A0AA39HKZ0_9BILA|nr:hypothetical protein QR680_003608 [Steinernema hermaphroditum]